MIKKLAGHIIVPLALLILLVIWPAHGNAAGDLVPVSEYEKGRLFAVHGGPYRVAVLSGGWREMGRQYGGLLTKELRAFHDEITSDLEARGLKPGDQLAGARELQSTYSKELRLLMDGIAETSGLSLDQTLVLNGGMILLTQVILGDKPPAPCSGIAAWQKYTPEGRLVFGRDWDINREAMLRYMKYLGVVVFKPDGAIPFANIHPFGNVYLETGINNRGVFLELNNGEQSDPKVYEDREDTSSFLVRVLSSSHTLDRAVEMLRDQPADISYIIQVADAEKAVSVERPTFGFRVREGENGLLAAYNSFIPPYPREWEGLVQPPHPIDQDPRYRNLLSLAKSGRFFGKLDPKGMMELLKIPISEGGALHGGTVVQVVAVPETRTIWIRGVGHSDFQKVELARLF